MDVYEDFALEVVVWTHIGKTDVNVAEDLSASSNLKFKSSSLASNSGFRNQQVTPKWKIVH